MGEPVKAYLVGGCVRDKFLGLEAHDRDWVVVGATESELRKKGFKKVGAHFPVFLHPQTKEEYALARIERKHGQGYGGFIVQADPSVSLEDDLKRRDLTINAVAFDPELSEYIDPFGGLNDLKSQVLRHVSSAFADDPLRLVRLARFAAVFSNMSIAEETEVMALSIVSSGELRVLPVERVTVEIEKAYLKATDIKRFWSLLLKWGALNELFIRSAFDGLTWNEMIQQCHVPQKLSATARWPRVLAQILDRCGALVFKRLLLSLSVSCELQRLAKLAVSWWKLIRLSEITAEGIVSFLSQNRLFQHPEHLTELHDLLTEYEHKELLLKTQQFVDKMALESPRRWLEEYPPAQRRYQLEQYYETQAKEFFS